MLKWLLLFAFAYLIYRWWSRASLSAPTQKKEVGSEPMIECAQCGVHFPQSEAVAGDDCFFCSEAHRISWKQSH